MLNTIKNILFSTRLTAILLLVFAIAIGAATFIENEYKTLYGNALGISASKALVFNARWFELIIFLLGINLVGNIFRYKMWKLEKLSTFLFHLSLIIIVVGAGITRYISYEGTMPIREGATSNTIISDDTFLRFKVDDKKMQYAFEQKLYLNPLYNAPFNRSFDFEGKDVQVSYKDFVPNSIDTVVEAKDGVAIVEIVTVGNAGRLSRYIEDGQVQFFGNIPVSFNNASLTYAVQLSSTDSGMYVISPYDIEFMVMDDQSRGVLERDIWHPFKHRRLYTIEGVQLVFKNEFASAKIERITAPKTNVNGEDALLVDVTSGNETKEVTLFGGKGYISKATIFQLNGLNFSLAYGAKQYTTPFYVRLNDFKMEKYPGSKSPSSYESEVTLMDPRSDTAFDQRIYMNHVLDYDGYRFFQSSYDQDELGTILSVNHDYWGTLVSYIGYFLMFLGMIVNLFMRKSRFAVLRGKVKELRKVREKTLVVLLPLFMLCSAVVAQHQDHKHETIEIDAQHAEQFSRLLMQDQGGRMKPIHTFAAELLRKVTHKTKFNGLAPEQVLLSMLYDPAHWQDVPFIYVDRKNEKLKNELGVDGNYVSFIQCFDERFQYKLAEAVSVANRKKPAARSKYDDEVLKVDERMNICYMVFQGNILRIFPKHLDSNNTWYTSLDYREFTTHDSIFVKAILPLYYQSIHQSMEQNDWSIADSTLKYIADYQTRFGSEVLPKAGLVDAEISYNKINIFGHLFRYYPLIGIVMLILVFSNILKVKRWKKRGVIALSIGLAILFLFHTLGLAARWYISGHAPWSNGYEAMLLVSWVGVLAGFLFSRNNQLTLAASAILACVVLFVANLNFLDPEITPLVPVLKSYWLMVHVAIIVGSYAPLALGAILGFINLWLMIVYTKKSRDRIVNTIKELTYISEMTLTVGVFMAAIGTFLGGIWANESWGRYWGWDPKETWALVIVLVYAMILHLRFIPKCNGKYLFNLLSVLGFSTVIMTYFGVNYYLSGLHSYAAGDPLPIPNFVYYTIGVVFMVALVAYFRGKKLIK